MIGRINNVSKKTQILKINGLLIENNRRSIEVTTYQEFKLKNYDQIHLEIFKNKQIEYYINKEMYLIQKEIFEDQEIYI